MPDGPRLLRPVGAPLGVYLRPGRNDHNVLLQLFVEGRTDLSGVVFDPMLDGRQGELRSETRRHRLEAVLDPRSVDLATVGGVARSHVDELPWAGDELPHTPEALAGAGGRAFVDALAEHVVARDYTAVLAPAHYLADASSPWVAVDAALTRQLRQRLDSGGRSDAPIYYPLALTGAALRDPAHRAALMASLRTLPIDGVWLRVHPFGTTTSGPHALRRYIEGCRELHQLGLPLVGEHTGTVGLALMTFGAVGAVESGLTYGERYDVAPLLKPPGDDAGGGFSPSPRVYLPQLGTFLTRAQARTFFENRQMKTLFACQDATCCRRGAVDMSADPRRHFVIRRTSEVSYYSRPPAPLRAGVYLEEFLRPATDLALRATRVEPALEPTRRRLESWRNTLGALHQQGVPPSFAIAPEGRRVPVRQQGLGA